MSDPLRDPNRTFNTPLPAADAASTDDRGGETVLLPGAKTDARPGATMDYTPAETWPVTDGAGPALAAPGFVAGYEILDVLGAAPWASFTGRARAASIGWWP